MGVAIDRNRNIIINTQGRAHGTGWVIVDVVQDFRTMKPIGWGIARGRGYYQGGVHKTESLGPVIRLPGSPGDLTAEEFREMTGWAA